jgi:hypothetical protein
MFRYNQTKRMKLWGVAATLLPGYLLVGLAATARAQAPTWELKISEKELALANPTDPMWMKSNMWDVSFQRMHDRNAPTLELTNVSPAGSPSITKLTLSIGDSRFHFSDDMFGSFIAQCPCAPSANINDPTPDGLDLTSSVSQGGNLLTVDISKQGGDGLAPGETVRFRIDIDVDAGFNFFQHPDYRTVMFDMNGVQVYGPDPAVPPGGEDNSQASVAFSNGSTAGPAVFIDEIVTGPQGDYWNNIFRPYGVMEPVDIFEISGGPQVIPEPSSGVLIFASLISALGGTARQRRSPSTK